MDLHVGHCVVTLIYFIILLTKRNFNASCVSVLLCFQLTNDVAHLFVLASTFFVMGRKMGHMTKLTYK